MRGVATLFSTRSSQTEDFVRKVSTDNVYRLALSLTTFGIISFLHMMHTLNTFGVLSALLVGYSLPYLTVWYSLSDQSAVRVLDFILNMVDLLVLALVIHFTGGIHSPFIYLYILPIIVQTLHFDLPIILWDTAWSIVTYACIVHVTPFDQMSYPLIAGQFLFLLMVAITSVISARLLRSRQASVDRGIAQLESTVQFLAQLNESSPNDKPREDRERLIEALQKILKPFNTHARLWIYDQPWKIMQSYGEHPAMRPGAAAYMPSGHCPAFDLKRTFEYSKNKGKPCPTEQFNYSAHRCLPLIGEENVFGVLFLGTYTEAGWSRQDLQFFDTLAQAIALTLQRRTLFSKLQETIDELRFSFEVGASSLATFGGSTQSLDEATVHILDGVLSILKVDRASLMLWNPTKTSLQTQWVRGGDFKIQSPLRLRLGEGMAGWALQTGEPYWAEYAMSDPHYRSSSQPVKSLLCVPIFTQDSKPLGVINAVTVQAIRSFSSREIDFLKAFGQQAALAIENAHLHQQNRQNIQQLKEIDKMKSEFLSLVSHDLRGPLTGMRGFCEVLSESQTDPLSTRQRSMVELLERQIELQERMVEDLLDLARLEKGQLSMEIKPTDLSQLLIEEVNKIMPVAQERDVLLELHTPDPDALKAISIDAHRIRQVLWNLIHNALKFTPESGKVTVEATRNGDRVIIQICDTGVGVSPEMLDRIFDKFFQVSPGGSKSAQGLGLGLAICREIVVAHQGRIWAASPGLKRGTTIAFEVPVQPALLKSAIHTLAA